MVANEIIPFTSTTLTSNWTFKQGNRASTHEYLPANDVPTEVHRDLLKNHRIPDPFDDLNELAVRWVGDKTWTYRTTFDSAANYGNPDVCAFIRFEGLDTFAQVYLNGEKILGSDNMFVEHTVDVLTKLQATDNVIEIVFESARKKGLELVKEHDEHRFIVHQTEISRGPVRKAQYHWGWDWGPVLMSCGPWRPIVLETFVCKISDLSINYILADHLKSVEVTATVTGFGPVGGVTFTLTNNKTGEKVASESVRLSTTEKTSVGTASFRVNDIDLWWPRGYGAQTLYTVSAEAQLSASASSPPQSLSKVFGFRKVDLVQEPDSHGTSFYFRINNVDIFIGGSCWIPADSFLTRLTPEKYRFWVELAADDNQNMLRVWGGGIYEADAFYDAADELGILVWQDFMFACANYPGNKEYLRSVEGESEQNVKHLQHHPSIILWCGNNEDYQIVERYGLQYDVDHVETGPWSRPSLDENVDPKHWLESEFPARYIYEHILPRVVSRVSPGTVYHPSSPFGNGRSTTQEVDPTIGDVHQWNVWGGTMEPYQQLPNLGGRFVSEFGMEAYPHVSTLERCITNTEDRYPGSMAMDFRNKAAGHERRLLAYVAENFRIRYDLAGFTHLTQVMQADAMSWAYKSWRRQWGVPGQRKCGGVLVWQLNDCWPTMSWAIVDYYLVPRPAYYAIKRAMQPVTVGIQRKYKPWTMRPADTTWQRDTGHVDMQDLWRNAEFDIWIANSTTAELKCEVDIKCFSIHTGAELQRISKTGLVVLANQTTEIFCDYILIQDETMGGFQPFELAKQDPYVVEVSLWIEGVAVARDTAWPDPIKYLKFDDRKIEIQYDEGNASVVVSAKKPVKGFVFGEKEGMKLSDNGFDLMPLEPKEIRVSGCDARSLEWMYVGK